ncbi:hypothetical protein [Archaeoglobus profundus]|uniref:Uncharacterized protein n=1 Tax=Archaeoglobus profundus (strain DSM 5631 / JCM 9629 / NBRC 100127 / Av18) TaxID=572546 RepID=D2RDM2_ARCPA|nr:hypothetical protein [Archaeoglobus profundus]ADB58216.1 hypothetical protein Arcpr_1161 [Archaeoglobus profundus DSM 5631]
MKYTVRLKGEFDLSEDDVKRFHPWINPLLEEIKKKGWKYRISDVSAEVLVELNLDELTLTLKYYPPRIEEFDKEGTYEISAEIGNEPPAVMKILSVEKFNVEISTEHCWHAVEINPFKREVKWIKDVLWFGLDKDGPNKLSEAREVYEVAKWLIKEKKFRPADDYVVEKYKRLLDLFEKPYKFTLTLELAVEDIDRVPGWEELKKDLCHFFRERGLLVELKKGDKDVFGLFRKPLP